MTTATRRRVGRLLVVLLALTLAVVTPDPAPVRATPDPTPPAPVGVTVLSWNIRHGVGTDGRLDLERTARVIRESYADVVALQEVDRSFGPRSGHADQAALLGRMLSMDHAHGVSLDLEPEHDGGPRRRYGVAVLSRFPIAGSTTFPLPGTGGEPRVLLQARVLVPGVGPVAVHSAHLEFSDAAERGAQVRAIVERLPTVTDPVVLGADLNAPPEAPELRPLLERLLDRGSAPTFPSGAPQQRIDYVLADARVAVRGVDALTAGAAGVASDHLPVRARVRVGATTSDPTMLAAPGA